MGKSARGRRAGGQSWQWGGWRGEEELAVVTPAFVLPGRLKGVELIAVVLYCTVPPVCCVRLASARVTARRGKQARALLCQMGPAERKNGSALGVEHTVRTRRRCGPFYTPQTHCCTVSPSLHISLVIYGCR